VVQMRRDEDIGELLYKSCCTCLLEARHCEVLVMVSALELPF